MVLDMNKIGWPTYLSSDAYASGMRIFPHAGNEWRIRHPSRPSPTRLDSPLHAATRSPISLRFRRLSSVRWPPLSSRCFHDESTAARRRFQICFPQATRTSNPQLRMSPYPLARVDSFFVFNLRDLLISSHQKVFKPAT